MLLQVQYCTKLRQNYCHEIVPKMLIALNARCWGSRGGQASDCPQWVHTLTREGTDVGTLAKAPGQRKSVLGKGVSNVLGEGKEASSSPALGAGRASRRKGTGIVGEEGDRQRE